MISIQRILCPTDFSDFSRHALDYAVAIAKWYDAAVTVLHVVAPVVPPTPIAAAPFSSIVLTPDDLKQFEEAIAQFVRTEVGDAVATVLVREGSAVGETVRVAESWPADLIVMGTHGRTGFDHLMVGSVAERVLRKARCPVLTVPRRMPDVVPVGGPPFKRILCAVDFSASSVNALEHAASLAEEADATLTLLQVIEQDVVDSSAMPAAELYSGAPDGEAALRQLRRIVPSEVRTYAEVREVVTAGKAHQEILRHARDDGAELIVMGAHGGHLIAAFGSTTDRVLREATCPVLTVKG